MLIPANRTEQPFWGEMVEPYRDRPEAYALGRYDGAPRYRLATEFLQSRISFGHPGNPEGVNVGSPQFGCVLLVWRRV